MRDIIQGKRLLIRRVQEHDLDYLLKWWNDSQVMASVGFPDGLSLSMKDMETKYWPQWRDDPEGFQRIICLNDGTPIGEANFHNYYIEESSVQIGLKICLPELWNQGLGTEALQMMIHYAFEVLKVDRVYVNPAKTNHPVIRINEKCCFRTIGETEGGGLLMELKRELWEKKI
ncbi:GNAT family N-acetyltransferase [candidate division WOR-3 bacterium]|nr:GNAT family N-acetyltransferase [candidate division WOR-3 bacterium]